MIQILNSQSGKKEEFKPLTPGEVKMYVCGPTVYNFLHVGNFRGATVFNMVRNWLEKRGFKVTFVYNYTDVDDKIIDVANKRGVSSREISELYIKEFENDFNSLKLRKHTHNPRVTEFMGQIISFVEQLIANGKAYVVEGDVYYDVHSIPDYGKLSNKNLADLEAGARVEVDSRKKHAADFALWKSAKPGEPSWPSPWGEGRPGWHIECSAMARTLLGDSIDIHGGGLDLLFPHHENEVAQSEGATGKPFVKYWMHNNMLQFGAQKMSKSLGNIVSARDFIAEHNAEILKFMFMSAHYRSIIDFSDHHIEQVISQLARIYSALAWAEKLSKSDVAAAAIPETFKKEIEKAQVGVETSMDDDFNTAEAMGKIFEVVRAFNNLTRTPGPVTAQKKAIAQEFLRWTLDLGSVMALFQEPAAEFLRTLDDMLLKKKNLIRSDIDAIVVRRSKARTEKDFKTSDELRDQLAQMGIAVQDTAQGSEWEVMK